MSTTTESDWWHFYVKPYLSAEIAARNMSAMKLRESSLYIWMPRQ
jgi:hypothetical protein